MNEVSVRHLLTRLTVVLCALRALEAHTQELGSVSGTVTDSESADSAAASVVYLGEDRYATAAETVLLDREALVRSALDTRP